MKRLFIAFLVAAGLFAQSTIRLADIKKIYIQKMDNGLDEYLRASISKKFHGRLTIVLDPAQADAVLKGTDQHAQRTQSATVDLIDPKSPQAILWSGAASDRDMKFLNMKHGGQQQLADRLAGDLKKAMER